MKTLKSDTTSFHLQLLSNIINMQQYPFIKLIIENNITHKEYEELSSMLQHLNEQYEIQKEEGFLDFTSLLIQFAGMLTEKLEPNKTIYALKREGYYPSLMEHFSHIIEINKQEFRGW